MTAKIRFYTVAHFKVGVKRNPLNAIKTALKCSQLTVLGSLSYIRADEFKIY